MRSKFQPKFEPVPEGIDYFDLPQASNSDFTELYMDTHAHNMGNIDKEKAYSFGSLFDAVVTEQDKVNVFKNQVAGKTFDNIEFEVSKRMRDSFFSDKECRELYEHAEYQKITIRTVPLAFNGRTFVLPMRCKWDFWLPKLWFGADLKSTAATTQSQFEGACKFFNYDRQRAVYMTIAGSSQDILIGVSKVNFKVFKLRVARGNDFFNSGMSKFLPLAFKYYLMYG